jgi:hypothetical protein
LICTKEGDEWIPYECDDYEPYKVPYLCCGCCFNWFVRKRSKGYIIDWIKKGELSVEKMFEEQKKINQRRRIAVHSAGFLMFFVGITLILHPISVLFSTMGFIGYIVQYNLWLGALLIGTITYLLTLTFVWFYYRPTYASGMLILSIAILILIAKLTPKHH